MFKLLKSKQMTFKEKIDKLKKMNTNNDSNAMAYLEEVAKSCITKEDKELLQDYTNGLVSETEELVINLENDIRNKNIKH